jgi:hydroxymethylbilane synthase
MRQNLRIATRKSPLALWQAEFIKSMLQTHYPTLEVELVTFTTTGDRFLNQSLSKIGGKGLFTKELETALLEKRADLAVHSMKDVPVKLPEGLILSTILQRADPRDALITKEGCRLQELPDNAIIGTSSLRRAIQIKKLLPSCQIKPLRGNINTRLSKLSQFDAIILASIGLKRLKFESKINHYFAQDEMIPAAGQGALGIECREDDQELLSLLKPLNCPQTSLALNCERHFNLRLDGRCDVPIAVHATPLQGKQLTLSAMVGSINSGEMLIESCHGAQDASIELANQAADSLIRQGANALLSDNP